MATNRVAHMVALRKADSTIVEQGDKVTDFRGDTWVFLYCTRPAVPGKSGKVLVTHEGTNREFYDKVFDLHVSGLMECGCPASCVYDGHHHHGCTVTPESDTVPSDGLG